MDEENFGGDTSSSGDSDFESSEAQWEALIAERPPGYHAYEQDRLVIQRVAEADLEARRQRYNAVVENEGL
jgi:hypothetical protein